ncbi:MAG: sialate O-acetylesterase [Desulfobacteraceae bacterium]|nr:sialate O-acetylesterase [Desulfobacteraceae bacterium]
MLKVIISIGYIWGFILIFPLTSQAVTVNPFFGNNMMLQREKLVPIWGSADQNEDVTVTFAGQTKTALPDNSGYWIVRLDPMAANANGQQLRVQGNNTITFANVVIGDIWFCTGQSNMEQEVQAASLQHDPAQEAAMAQNMRLIRISSGGNLLSQWEELSPDSVGAASAVGWFFGKKIQSELGVPIGLYKCARGGTPVESWMNEESISKIVNEPDISPDGTFDNKVLGAEYANKIKPYMPFAIRGNIWYQGERNSKTNYATETYSERFMSMIEGWRDDFETGDFPFYWVQLPRHFEPGFPTIREQQRLSLQLLNTGMITTLDLGNTNLHPDGKDDMGSRMADLALAHHYKVSNKAPMGPMYDSYTIDGASICLKFRHFGAGIVAQGSRVEGFEIAGANGEFYPATGAIDGDEIILQSEDVSSPTQAHYAWLPIPEEFSIYNSEGLPASPFRTYGPQLPDDVFRCAYSGFEGYNEDAVIHDLTDCINISPDP